MRLMRHVFSMLAATALCGATAALAEDLTGYVGFDLGPDWQTGHWDGDEVQRGPGGWAAAYGRLGVDLADEITAQFDAWLRRGEGEIDDDDFGLTTWYQLQGGAAAHLTYRNGDFLGGVAGSLGFLNGNDEKDSTYGSVALESGFDADEFSLIGHLGYTGSLSGYSKDIGEEILFAALDAAYYLNPDFSLSAQISWSRYTDEANTVDQKDVTALVVGFDYKLPDQPLILTGRYMAEYYDYTRADVDVFSMFNQRVTVGARIPFGEDSGTLRDLDRATGLEHLAGYYNR